MSDGIHDSSEVQQIPSPSAGDETMKMQQVPFVLCEIKMLVIEMNDRI